MKRLVRYYLRQLPPKQVYCNGRFSDGYNWVDYLTQTYKIQLYNYAVGGSSIHPYNLNRSIQYRLGLSFKEQIDRIQYDLASNLYRIEDDDVVFMMGGGNDLTSYYLHSNPGEMANDMRFYAHRLSQMGFNRIYIGNAPYLKYTPLIQQNFGKYDKEMILKNTDIYNMELENQINFYKLINKFLFKFNQKSKYFYNKYIDQDNYKNLDGENDYDKFKNINKNNFEIFDFNSTVRRQSNFYNNHLNSVPCFFGKVSSLSGYFTKKIRVRSDIEELEYYSKMSSLLATKLNVYGIRDFYMKFYNTKCDNSKFKHKYLYFDLNHPMSHVHRDFAIEIEQFLRSNGVDLGEKREMILESNCDV